MTTGRNGATRAFRLVRDATDPAEPEPLLTVKEVATRLRVGRSKAYALVRAGTLPSVRFPHSPMVRVAASALADFVRAGGAP